MPRSEPLVPPQNVDAEQSVLGGMMLLSSSQPRFRYCVENLSPSDFYRPDHREIFKAIIALTDRGSPHDYLTIPAELEGNKHLKFHGEKGAITAYCGTLAKDTPSAANVQAYAKIVKNAAVRRQTIEAAQAILEKAYEHDFSDEGVDALVESIAQYGFELEQGRVTGDQSMKPMVPILKAKLAEIQERANDPSDSCIKGQSTGLVDLDKRWSGLENGKLYLVAGIPASGKTTLALNAAEHIAFESAKLGQDEMVNIFSIEMTEDELAEKFMASAGRADFGRIREPKRLEEDDWARIGMGLKKLKTAGIYIDDDTRMTPNKIRRKLRATMHETGRKPRLIVADFLQIMEGDNGPYANENDRLGDISVQTKSISKEFDCPFILVSQLNRECAKRTNPVPIMSDLRGSGMIEAVATVIMFVHRPAAVAMVTGGGDDLTDLEKREAQLVTAKCKAGSPGIDRVVFNGEFQRFDDYVPEYQSNGENWA